MNILLIRNLGGQRAAGCVFKVLKGKGLSIKDPLSPFRLAERARWATRSSTGASTRATSVSRRYVKDMGFVQLD